MRFFFPIVLLLTLAALGTYGWLGGFRQPEVQLETTAAPTLLAGQDFQGPAESEEFGPLFRQASQAREHGQLRGDLANLYFNNPEKARDTLRAFVGLAVADTLAALPAGWRYRVVPAGRRVAAARLSGVSYLLAPGKLYPAIQEFMTTEKLKMSDFYLERFGDKGQAEVSVGVQENHPPAPRRYFAPAKP